MVVHTRTNEVLIPRAKLNQLIAHLSVDPSLKVTLSGKFSEPAYRRGVSHAETVRILDELKLQRRGSTDVHHLDRLQEKLNSHFNPSASVVPRQQATAHPLVHG